VGGRVWPTIGDAVGNGVSAVVGCGVGTSVGKAVGLGVGGGCVGAGWLATLTLTVESPLRLNRNDMVSPSGLKSDIVTPVFRMLPLVYESVLGYRFASWGLEFFRSGPGRRASISWDQQSEHQ
jgi:hypothetical protein